MRVFSIAKGFHYLWKHTPPELSQKELDRLRAITLWQQTRDACLVCRTFGISRAAVTEPGDLVQVDTLDIRPVPDTLLKQFTARDIVSKWDALEARSRATAKTAKEFLDKAEKRMPFPIKAIQIDGSEFFAEFEEACKQKGIRLFVLPPKSPKLNGCVERSNRTHTEEFYEVYDCSWVVPELNKQLLEWEYVYNCIRPHKALGLKTPLQFLKDRGIIQGYKPLPESHMS